MKGLLLALGVGCLALSASRVHAAPQALRYTIVSVQPQVLATAGQTEADLAYQAGFDSLRVIMPWSYPLQADVENDKQRLCNVAAEASSQHMALFLDLVPVDAPPVTATQIRTYTTTLAAYMSYLIGPMGCAQKLMELDIEVANEPNYSVFWPPAAAPEDYSHLVIRTWRSVHKEAASKGYSVPVYVVGGELSSSRDPVTFINQMAAEAKLWRIHGPFFDRFSYHCYGTNGTDFTPPDAVNAALTADFGQAVPLLCSEFAVATAPLSVGGTTSLTSQSEKLQGRLFCQAETMAANSGLVGFGWFRLFDDPTGARTGLYYYDPALGLQGDQPVAKSSLAGIPGYNATALSGGSPVCN